MEKYTFIYNDGSISAHDTLEGMVEMLLDELLDEDRVRESESYYRGEWSKQQKVDFITMFDIEIIEGKVEQIYWQNTSDSIYYNQEIIVG